MELMDSNKSINSSTLSPEAPIVQNDEMTNNEILQRLCSRGKLTVAARLIDVMARKSQIPHFPSCTNLIRGFIRKCFVDEACKTLNKMVMSGGVPDTVTYNMVIGGLCKKVVQAVSFWRDQLRKGSPPYLITYTVLIELVCKYCGASQALEVLEDMAMEGCYPDIVTDNSLVNLTSKQGKYEDTALVILNLLSHGMQPNAVTYNTLIHSLINHGYWDEVEDIMKIMNETSSPPTHVTYNILLNGLCKSGLLDVAISFYSTMVTENCSPDIITYNTLLSGLCKEGFIDEGIQLLNLLVGTSCSPGLVTYNIVIDGLARLGSMESAKELHDEGKGIIPDEITNSSLTWGFCRADKLEEATELLKEMSMKERIKNTAYRCVILGLCRQKKVDIAIQVLDLMVKSQCNPDERIYSALIKAVADGGMLKEDNDLHQTLIKWKTLKKKSF
ncbi:Pentatricopeptide repeat-containing protein [Glycine soja]|nr:Pentatricopeptide repeat-containing protein [Glycine soja]